MEQGVGRSGLDEQFQTPERAEEPLSRPERVARVSVEVLFRGQERWVRSFVREPDMFVVRTPTADKDLFVVGLKAGVFPVGCLAPVQI